MSEHLKSQISEGLSTSLHSIPISSIPHNHYNTLKKAFSDDVFRNSEWCIPKTSATRILQELKRGKSQTKQIISIMEKQLFDITNYLISTPESIDDIKALDHTSRKCLPLMIKKQEPAMEKESDVIKLVKNDEGIFESSQLWKYVDEAGFFKIIAAQDVEDVFQIKDHAVYESSTNETFNTTAYSNMKTLLKDGPNLMKYEISDEIGFLKSELDRQCDRNSNYKILFDKRMQSEAARSKQQREAAEPERQYQVLVRFKKEILRKKKHQEKRRLRFCPLRS
uniref:AlNc14C227G9236 protein n=1 Tax=Albugo laibachii Nc14 TaxID=890382 RepID=F0WS97_9STRA|nr:AlNc14C227G9236 [Albugo laibachii Nc14]CCA26938.1 AlNc14C433G11605 [Albugo laibachii Nc14]|eukprot:CCA26938.1 AlNc14C433G11605 [Albugo laibachii Nc14]